MPNTSINILSPNDKIINYIDNVNYGISKPQFNHLSSLMHGLINVHGNKSISSIAESILSAKDKSCIYRFLSKSQWDDSLIDRNRIAYLNMFLETNINHNSVGFLAIDDTVNPKPDAKKIQGLNYHFSHAEGKSVWSHCVVTSNFVAGDISVPVYLMSTDLELDPETIIQYYLHRWSIETNYKYLKSNLGFDKYRVRGIISIERYFLIVFLAVNFLEIFRVSQRMLMLKTIGETIRYQNNLAVKELILFVYSKAKENVSVDEIYSHLKIA